MGGTADMSGMHVVAPDSDTAWCADGEMMVSAICVNSTNPAPVSSYPNGAKCAYGDGSARARIICTPAAEKQGSLSPAGGSMMAGLGIHLVSSDSNVASCKSDETLFSAYCSGGYDTYPLLAYPDGRVKCGYSGGASKANVACMPKDDSAAKEAGLRVVASDTNTAWCSSGETMVSAYCTGGWSKYPLQTYPDGAKCGYSGGSAKATVICSSGSADASAGIRVVSGSNFGSCDSGETMVSAYCSGVGSEYPLTTYPNSAKCGYSGDKSQVTLLCMKM